MSFSKLSITEVPISVRWKIPNEKLLAESQKEEEWFIESEKFSFKELPSVSYSIKITSKMHEDRRLLVLFLILKMENQLNMNVSYKLSIPTANYVGINAEEKDEGMHVYGTYIGEANEIFDLTRNYIVNDCMIITMKATLSVEKAKTNGAGADAVVSKCCDLGSRLWDQDGKDFAFCVKEKEIMVHKFVLCAKSPVFARMIECGMKESIEGKVIIIDFDYKTVEAAINFCYGIVEQNLWSVESAADLLRFAEKYDISDLKASMVKFLSTQISPMTVCKVANASFLGNCIQLRQQCFEYLLDSMKDATFITFCSRVPVSYIVDDEKCEQEEEEDQTPPIRIEFAKEVSKIAAFREFWQSIHQTLLVTIYSAMMLVWMIIYVKFTTMTVLSQRTLYKLFSLFGFTFSSGFLIASYISHYSVTIVTPTFAFISFLTALLVLFASFAKIDFTRTSFFWFVCTPMILLNIYSVFGPLLSIIPWNHQIFCILSALISMFCFGKNVQQVMGIYENYFDEDDSYEAAITIFKNFVQMFIFIFGAIGGENNFFQISVGGTSSVYPTPSFFHSQKQPLTQPTRPPF
uniref:BTB domain-containing protein n=1 Tax=Panagrolaimus sp. PS1159 TaxID=55785 RepID=A0AC35GXH7_9BILA